VQVLQQHLGPCLRLSSVKPLPDFPAEQGLLIHGVQKIFHPPARLPKWPKDEHETLLVMIVKDLPETYVRELFDAFLGKAGIDRPDRAAMMDNPLAIPGYSTR